MWLNLTWPEGHGQSPGPPAGSLGRGVSLEWWPLRMLAGAWRDFSSDHRSDLESLSTPRGQVGSNRQGLEG